MKQNKTRWLFAATVAIFWLALLLTLALPKKSKSNETSTLSYAVPTNVTKLHIDDVNYLRTYSGANIKFTQDDHITLEIENSGLDQPPQDASIFFEQQGEQLVLRKLPADANMSNDGSRPSWMITEISLPLAITTLSSTAEDITITSNVSLPRLTVRSSAAIYIGTATINQLDIYSHAVHCGLSEDIAINNSTIQQLYIESLSGMIDIQSHETIENIALYTKPSVELNLKPISNIQRIQWQALDEAAENHLCKNPSALNQNIKQEK